MIKKIRNVLINAKSRYMNISLPAKAAIWYMVSNILQRGITLLSTPIFTRLLTTEEYGVFTVYQSWYLILAIIATLYLYSGVYNNGLIKFPEDTRRFTSSMMGLTIACSFVLLCIYFSAVSFWNNILGLSTILVVAIFIQSLSTAAFSFWAKQQRFEYKYKLLLAITIAITIFSPVLGIIGVLSTHAYKAEARILSAVFVMGVVGLYFLIKIIKEGKVLFSKRYWKYAITFSIPLIPHYLSQMVLAQSDRIMIDALVGKSEAGIYGLVYTIAMMMTVITQAINDSIIPYTYQNLKKGNISNIKDAATKSLLFISAGCLIVMVIAPEIIMIFATPDYYDAIKIMPAVAASTFFMFLYTLYGNIEFYFEKTRYVMYASCFAAIFNVLLNYIFIPVFGYIAAGYTTLISYILYAIMHGLFYRHICKESLGGMRIYSFKLIFFLSMIIIICSVAMLVIYQYSIIRFALIFGFILFIVIKFKWIKGQLVFLVTRKTNDI